MKATNYKKVLVIDDNEIDCYITTRNILRYEFAEEVINEKTAKGALNYLHANASSPADLPQIIFLDIRMPEMDGYEFLAEFEKLPAAVLNHCKIMVLSSSAHTEDVRIAFKNPFVTNYLNKPLDKSEMEKIRSSFRQII